MHGYRAEVMRRWTILTLLLASATSTVAEIRTETVTYHEGGTALRGTLCYDDAKPERRPGVLVVHEWWGMNAYAKYRARALAELGHVAFAADMYGDGRVTQNHAEASQWSATITSNLDRWRRRAQAGLDVLRRHRRVDADRLAAIGYCFGGATVMQLAYSDPQLRAAISFHGSLPVPDLADASKIRARILVCHGAADAFVPLGKVDAFQTALHKVGVDWQMVSYGGARHSFTNPAADTYGIEGVAYQAAADRRSWKHLQVFLEEAFGSDHDIR